MLVWRLSDCISIFSTSSKWNAAWKAVQPLEDKIDKFHNFKSQHKTLYDSDKRDNYVPVRVTKAEQGSTCKTLRILKGGTRWRWQGTQWIEGCVCPRLCVPQTWSEHSGGENLLSLPHIKPRTVQSVTYSLCRLDCPSTLPKQTWCLQWNKKCCDRLSCMAPSVHAILSFLIKPSTCKATCILPSPQCYRQLQHGFITAVVCNL